MSLSAIFKGKQFNIRGKTEILSSWTPFSICGSAKISGKHKLEKCILGKLYYTTLQLEAKNSLGLKFSVYTHCFCS